MASIARVPLHEVKKDDIWFEDGNIVLVAGAVAFRVYKGLLSSVSPVFKDLFTLPQGEPDDDFAESMDGCPVVRLLDSAIQMRHFLSAVTQSSFCIKLLQPSHHTPFDTLAAIVRIAHKYQAEEIVTAAYGRLETFFVRFPTDAAAYIEIGGSSSHFDCNWSTLWRTEEHIAEVNVELSHATQAVNLARFLGRPEWIPFAIFLCCIGDPLHLRNGVCREDGNLERLSGDDYMRCVRAIPAIHEKSYELVKDLLASHRASLDSDSLFSRCTQKQQCQAVFEEMASEFEKERFSVQALTDIFVRLSHWSKLPDAIHRKRSDICPACWVRLTSIGQYQLYEKTWEQIAASINAAL